MRKVTKTLLFSFFCIALLFSCQLPETGKNVTAQAEARAVSTDFRAPSQDPPGGLTPAQVPQFVVLGFDDNQFADGMINTMNMMRGKFNPVASNNPYTFDGTPLSASYYNVPAGEDATEQWFTGDDTIEQWKISYRKGHEIGNHTWSHMSGGLSRSLAGWVDQIQRGQDFLVERTGSTPIGFRVPFLEYNLSTMQAMENVGLLYDCSYEGGRRASEDGSTLYWPYTMDNGAPAGEGGRALPNIAGMWELPTDIFYYSGGTVTGFDYNLWFTKNTSAAQFFDILKSSLDRKYNGNKSPMNVGLHSNYYSAAAVVDGLLYDNASWSRLGTNVQQRIDGLNQFIAYAQSLPDVRIVSNEKLLQWLRNPVALGPSTAITHQISGSVVSSNGGEVNPAGNQNIIAGETVTYYVNPDPGYLIDTVTVDGVDQGNLDEHTFPNVSGTHSVAASFRKPSAENALKSTILSMTSVAENYQTLLKFNYAENIGDNRGITFGAAGFTSGTFDGNMMLHQLQILDSTHPLCSYIPAFDAIDAGPHPGGLNGDVTGLDNFIADFTAMGNEDIVKQAQLILLDDLYYTPAEQKYLEIGGTMPITQAFIYDSTLNHGMDDYDGAYGCSGLILQANTAMGGTPATGVNETLWLKKLMEIRRDYLLSDPVWAESVDRIAMFERVLDAGKTQLTNPIDVECYGGLFTIWGTEILYYESSVKHNVTITSGPNGTTTPTGVYPVTEGGNLTVKMIPESKYYVVDDVKVDGISVGAVTEYRITNVRAPQTLSATFKLGPPPPEYTVTASAGPNGTVSPATAQVVDEDDHTIIITPAATYRVDTITVNGVVQDSVSLPFVLRNVREAKDVVVTFTNAPICPLPIWDRDTIYQGESVHWAGHDWQSKWYTVDEEPGTTGKWGVWRDLGPCGGDETHVVTSSAGANGTIDPEGVQVVSNGGSATFTVTANADYLIKSITVNGVDKGTVSPITVSNITSATEVIATFIEDVPPVYYDIVASAGANGSISDPGTTAVLQGTSKTYTITPANGYQVDTVMVGTANMGAITSYTFENVQAIGSISATFKPADPVVYFDITASAGANGSINDPGTVSVEQGTNKTYTITAASGYQVETVMVGTQDMGAITSYTFENVQADGSISATFIVQNVQPWAVGVAYALGAEVSHNGIIYVCDYAHTSNSAWYPGAPGLWLWRAL